MVSLHEQVDLENSSFQNFAEEIVFLSNGSNDANLDIVSADVFKLDSVIWMESCLLFGNSLPVTCAIAKLNASKESITMATKLFPSDSQTSAHAFDPVPYNLQGKQMFVDSIGGEVSSAANGCVKIIGMLTLSAFNLIQMATTQVVLFDPGGSLQFDPHCFLTLPVLCHQEKPKDINTHCFPTSSGMCCSSS